MRKLKIIEHISLDGVIQVSGEDGDFPYGDCTAPYRTPAGREALIAAHGGSFDLLLGRRTYDLWSGFWPKAPSSPMARAVAEEVDGHIDAFKWAGYNFQEIWSSDHNARGLPDDDRMWYERADLRGWPITGVFEFFQSYAATWSDPQTRERNRTTAECSRAALGIRTGDTAERLLQFRLS